MSMAAAAERCPPPVSEEMISIFGAFGFISRVRLSPQLRQVVLLLADQVPGAPFSFRAQVF